MDHIHMNFKKLPLQLLQIMLVTKYTVMERHMQQITDAILCASDKGHDACQGNSNFSQRGDR